ncbi:MAG: glycosyltransferase family 4 protein [Candidatus Diapherotrites archaeon]|nr:glycosyltransferase family 4 protein [Candidatus Diapherotrites archaeon]
MEKIRVCRFVGENFPSFEKINSGLAPNYYNLSKELAKLGVETSIVCPKEKGQKYFEETEGFTVHRFDAPKWKLAELFFNLPLNLAAWKKINSGIERDLFQFHNFYAYWVQKFAKEPNVLTVHGCDIEIYNNVPPWPIQMPYKHFKSKWDITRTLILSKKMCGNATRVVGVAKAVTKEVKEDFGVENAITIYNGIDSKIFFKRKENPFEKNSETFNILFVGRITPLKGIEYLFEAVDGIKNAKLFMIGDMNKTEETYMKIILSKIKNKENIIFLGKVPNMELPKYYSGADCMILPSLAEGFPKVVIEAMACGCPVIATNVSGNPEVVNEKTGYLVEPKNSAQLRAKILHVMQNREEAKKMAQTACKMILEKFTWENSAKDYAKLYKKMMAEKSR